MRNQVIRLPRNAVLEVTYQCNHRCLFCSCPWYAPEGKYPKGEELDLQAWKEVVDRLYDKGVEVFSISGGEALLKDCLPQILEYIHIQSGKRNKYPGITLISNGRFMTNEYLRLFQRYHVNLAMSLPGYATFKDHTGVDNADGVLGWFREAKRLRLRTTVNITVTRINYDELFETIALGLLNGASSVLLNRFLPGGRGLLYRQKLELSREQLNGMLDTAEEVLSYRKCYGYVGTEFPRCLIKDIKKYRYLGIGTQCAAAKGFFAIDPSGQIRTCNHSPRIVGHVLEGEMITDNAYWNLFAQSDYHPAYCANCSDIGVCDCGCREVSNILNGTPKGLDPCVAQ